MTEYLLSIDPGKSSGIALLSYEPSGRPVLEGAWQFPGGAEALSDWISRVQAKPHVGLTVSGAWLYPEAVICEAFTARSTEGFSYTSDSLEALPAIGVLIARGLVDRTSKRYRSPALQYFSGGTGKAEKKKLQHQFLKESGYYVTNKDFPESPPKDKADDARSAIAHGLSYLSRELGHKPTWEMIRSWTP